MTKEPLSKIQDTITGHNDFMIELAQQAGVDDAINDCVQQLKDLNREGMYEDFMRGKWSDLRWWMAAAINYNNMTLDRIKTGKFHTGQLEKIEKNTLQKSKTPKAKADLDRSPVLSSGSGKVIPRAKSSKPLFNCSGSSRV